MTAWKRFCLLIGVLALCVVCSTDFEDGPRFMRSVSAEDEVPPEEEIPLTEEEEEWVDTDPTGEEEPPPDDGTVDDHGTVVDPDPPTEEPPPDEPPPDEPPAGEGDIPPEDDYDWNDQGSEVGNKGLVVYMGCLRGVDPWTNHGLYVRKVVRWFELLRKKVIVRDWTKANPIAAIEIRYWYDPIPGPITCAASARVITFDGYVLARVYALTQEQLDCRLVELEALLGREVWITDADGNLTAKELLKAAEGAAKEALKAAERALKSAADACEKAEGASAEELAALKAEAARAVELVGLCLAELEVVTVELGFDPSKIKWDKYYELQERAEAM